MASPLFASGLRSAPLIGSRVLAPRAGSCVAHRRAGLMDEHLPRPYETPGLRVIVCVTAGLGRREKKALQPSRAGLWRPGDCCLEPHPHREGAWSNPLYAHVSPSARRRTIPNPQQCNSLVVVALPTPLNHRRRSIEVFIGTDSFVVLPCAKTMRERFATSAPCEGKAADRGNAVWLQRRAKAAPQSCIEHNKPHMRSDPLSCVEHVVARRRNLCGASYCHFTCFL